MKELAIGLCLSIIIGFMITPSCNQPSKTPGDDTRMMQPQEKGEAKHYMKNGKGHLKIKEHGKNEVEIELSEFYPFSGDLKVLDASTGKSKPEKGRKAWGVLNDTINAMYYDLPNGKKLGFYQREGKQKYYIHDDTLSLQPIEQWNCGTSDSTVTTQIQQPQTLVQLPTLTFTYVLRHSVFTGKGSNEQATIDYGMAIWAGVQWLYSQSFPSELNQLVYFSQPDPFTGTSSISILNSFGTWLDANPTVDGSAAIKGLLGIDPGGLGGVAKSIGTACWDSYDYFYADINSTFAALPNYSWTLEVVGHEGLHIAGLWHTHNCFYPNYFPALLGKTIDGCAPSAGYPVEGSGCTAGALPPNGGEGISYCHLTSIGIDFNNYFSFWTDSIIRKTISAYTCLAGSTVCKDLFEPNNTVTTAKGLQNKIVYSAGLDSVSGDQDWYKFQNTTTKKNITITCMNFSGTAYLNLQFKISGTWQTVASQQGTGAVTLNYNTTTNIGQYRLQVTSLSGLMVGCYTIKRELKQ